MAYFGKVSVNFMKKKKFFQGIQDGMPICLGYFSVSMAFGITAVLSGMPVWAAVLTSLSNVTSAGQFAGVGIIVAGGSMIELAFTQLIINMRYFLMSLSVSQKVESRMTTGQRLAVSYGITDEIFAVSMQHKGELTAVYMAGLILMPVLGWTGGTLVGAVATSVMPAILQDAMGIALYGMFIAIIVPPAREHSNVLFAVLAAVAASYAFAYLPVLKEISGGWSIIIITVVISALAAWLRPIEDEESVSASEDTAAAQEQEVHA